MSVGRKRIEVGRRDVIVYRDLEIDHEILDAILGTDKRLLWAFVRNEAGDVRAVPYSEERVIWLSDEDIVKEQDVEI